MRSKVVAVLAITLLNVFSSVKARAQTGATAANASIASSGAEASSATGATVTMQNWHDYQNYMPDGMAALFAGKYFWKMPADVEMPIGPTIIHPLPQNYVASTEKYASQVKLVELPNGGLTLDGYTGGAPFPNPAEPHQGWKILANLWFRYLPHLTVDTNGVVCTIDNSNSISCKAGMKVYRELAFNTDPGVPRDIPCAQGKFFTQYESVKEPRAGTLYHCSDYFICGPGAARRRLRLYSRIAPLSTYVTHGKMQGGHRH
jgi:hypothetical protein